jgi:enoyl-CoA hydratase/carnithine racemase
MVSVSAAEVVDDGHIMPMTPQQVYSVGANVSGTPGNEYSCHIEMSYNYLRIEDAHPAKIITLDAPQRRNALSTGLIQELLDALTRAAGARAVVLASSGPVFSSGHDLRELQAGEEQCMATFAACERLMRSLQETSVPVIAEVDGLATAAGCQLVAACDLAVASEEASFATPGVRIGLFCSTPMVPLVRAIGRKRAMEMLLTGDAIDARTALNWGLVNRVVPRTKLRSCTMQFVERIGSASRSTVASGKRTFYRSVSTPDETAYQIATREMIRSAGTPDAAEGISAFLTKREPVWPEPVDD